MNHVHFHRLQRLATLFFLSFIGIALTIGWWGVVQRATLEGREDNPRRVEDELRIQRGRVLDTNGVILAETVGEPDNLQRLYPLTYTAPAVGYYSFRYGTSGVEDALNIALRGETDDVLGEAWRKLLHKPQVGRDVRLALDANLQKQASELLGEYSGAVVLLTIPEGAIRVLLSQPLYDPNDLDEQFEFLASDESAPLLNRATQGQYQPGMVLEPFVLAAAVNQDLIALEDTVEDPNRPIQVAGQEMDCLFPVIEPVTWVEMLGASCPAPLVDLAPEFGAEGLQDVWNLFGFTTAPTITTVPLAEAVPGTISDPAVAIIGQEELVISPLQVAIAWSAIGNMGIPVQPRLVAAVQNTAGEWVANAENSTQRQPILSLESVEQIRNALPTAEQRALEYTTLVLSGPEESTNGWYLGLAPATAPRYAIVVVVEDVDRAAVAQQIGQELLRAVLNN